MGAGEYAGYLGAGVAAWAATLTYRASAKANSANARKVDLEEHRDSMSRLQAIINEQDRFSERLRAQLDRVNTQLDSLQQQLSHEQNASLVLRQQVTALQEHVRTLQAMIADPLPRRRAAMLANDELPPITDL